VVVNDDLAFGTDGVDQVVPHRDLPVRAPRRDVEKHPGHIGVSQMLIWLNVRHPPANISYIEMIPAFLVLRPRPRNRLAVHEQVRFGRYRLYVNPTMVVLAAQAR
jgi:hypothetical protein